jgi:tyrosine-protein phosphatase SIW14
MNIIRHHKSSAVFALAFCLPVWSAHLEPLGIPNFQQVNEHIFRGGQPADWSWQNLGKLGVKTVIDLRRADEHSTAAEAKAVAAAGLNYINVPMKGVVAPTDEQIAKVLGLLDSSEPVFVHCQRGADRTGTVIACYRIAHDGWERHRALNEAKSLGMRWTQVGLKRYIMAFQPAQKRAAVEKDPKRTSPQSAVAAEGF